MTLQEFFKVYPRCALAFSGGTDSAYLLQAGRQCGAEIRPYYMSAAFQPEFERDDALRLCRELGVELTVLTADILADEQIVRNPADRCYYCKRHIFEAIKNRALQDGYTVLLDGTNASDLIADRPGYRALQEFGVLSPLRLCGLTKTQIRENSRSLGLFTADKPAYACLATRIPTGELITADKLRKIELAENALFAMGFTDFRVRTPGGRALLQFTADQRGMAAARLDEIRNNLSVWFSDIELDSLTR